MSRATDVMREAQRHVNEKVYLVPGTDIRALYYLVWSLAESVVELEQREQQSRVVSLSELRTALSDLGYASSSPSPSEPFTEREGAILREVATLTDKLR